MKDILESQEITDPIIVKNADDIKVIKNAKYENNAAIKELDNRIYAMNEELNTVKDMFEKATKWTKCKQNMDGQTVTGRRILYGWHM